MEMWERILRDQLLQEEARIKAQQRQDEREAEARRILNEKLKQERERNRSGYYDPKYPRSSGYAGYDNPFSSGYVPPYQSGSSPKPPPKDDSNDPKYKLEVAICSGEFFITQAQIAELGNQGLVTLQDRLEAARRRDRLSVRISRPLYHKKGPGMLIEWTPLRVGESVDE
jgi:hypothetical protein